MIRQTLTSILVLSCAMLLAACPKKPTTVPSGTQGDTVAAQGGATTGAAGGAGGAQATPLGGGANSAQALATTIYFDFDNSEVKPEFATLIAQHAKRLAADRSLHVRLEGNTDERGSAEYNVALGERRAQAVKRALLLQGVAESQLATVSYGRERPVADGHDESAWSRNRRVEIVYTGGR
jgi:peptidoglycan-associated lipoprotein